MSRDHLSELRVVNPCPASWEEMPGTDQVRHCAHCKKNVHNISKMTQAEALELVRETEAHVCVRYHESKDGTILTRDSSIRDRLSFKARLILTAVAAVLGITMSGGCSSTGDIAPDNYPQSSTNPQSPTMGTPMPSPPPSTKVQGETIGKVATPENKVAPKRDHSTVGMVVQKD